MNRWIVILPSSGPKNELLVDSKNLQKKKKNWGLALALALALAIGDALALLDLKCSWTKNWKNIFFVGLLKI